MRFFKKIEKLIIKSRLKADAESEERILGGAIEALQRLKRTDAAGGSQPLRQRTIIRYKRAELVAAAVMIVVVLAGTCYFSGLFGGSGVAWAQVDQTVEQIETFTYRQRTTALALEEAETVLYFSPEYGVRLGTYRGGKINTRKFILPAEKIIITIMPQRKKYTRTPLGQEKLNEIQERNDPRNLIKQFTSGEYTELGRCKIGGVTVYGIAASKLDLMDEIFENAAGRLWVNAQTNLPVRMELEGFSRDGTKIKMVTDEFRWDAELGAADFGPNISPDYTLSGQMSEEQVCVFLSR